MLKAIEHRCHVMTPVTRRRCVALLALGCLLPSCGPVDTRPRVRMPRGARGVGFLPLLLMRKHRLIENHAGAAGLADLAVEWIPVGGPTVVNDALIAGWVDFIAAGPPAFLTLWDRTRENLDVRGVAAISSLPMFLNARAKHVNSLDDLREGDKIGVTAIFKTLERRTVERWGMST